MSAGEIAAKAGDLVQVDAQERCCVARRRVDRTETIEQCDLVVVEDQARRRLGRCAIDHGHTEQPPRDNAEQGDQVDQAFGGAQASIFGPGRCWWMEHSSPPAGPLPPDGGDRIPLVGTADQRRVDDLLPDSFAVERSEAEWLMTLLGPDELAYIFGDDHGGKAQG